MATIITEIRGVSSDTTPTPSASDWVTATLVSIQDESPLVKTFRFRFLHEVRHIPGQHYEIRLTAPDGYRAARLYSAASPAVPGGHDLELTIALMPEGEVSSYMHAAAKVGDQIELRGPLGKFFVWSPKVAQPALLVAGGTGVVPMRCMLLSRPPATPMRLLYSVRSDEEALYKDELLGRDDIDITVTRRASPDWSGLKGRITPQLLRRSLAALPNDAVCYVCGSTPFVEAMADMLVEIGVSAERVKTERFGSTA